MSVHQESMAHSAHAHEEMVVKKDIDRDMVTLLLTALGGAVIGTLLTLFLLAAINSGSLRYNGGAKTLDSVVAAHSQLSENVDTLTANMQGQNEQFSSDINAINEVVTGHSRSINQMAPLVARTSANSQQTSVLMDALEEAFGKASTAVTANELMVTDLSGEADTEVDSGPMLSLTNTMVDMTNLPAGMVTVLPFVDADGSGSQDSGELNEVGITASLIDAGGMSVATVESGDAGFNFRGIAPGAYELVVENGGAFGSLVGQSMPIEVGSENGHLIYMGIMEEGMEEGAEPADAAASDEEMDAGDGDEEHAGDEDHGEDEGHDEDDAHGEEGDHGEDGDDDH